DLAGTSTTGREVGQSHHRALLFSRRLIETLTLMVLKSFTGSRLRHWRRTSSGDGRGLELRCGRATRPDGYGSRPPPPSLRRCVRPRKVRVNDPRRSLPSVDRVLGEPVLARGIETLGRNFVKDRVRTALAKLRAGAGAPPTSSRAP